MTRKQFQFRSNGAILRSIFFSLRIGTRISGKQFSMKAIPELLQRMRRLIRVSTVCKYFSQITKNFQCIVLGSSYIVQKRVMSLFL